MQKATLAAVMATVLGLALSTVSFAADADKASSKSETTTKSEKDTKKKDGGHKKEKKESKTTTESTPAK